MTPSRSCLLLVFGLVLLGGSLGSQAQKHPFDRQEKLSDGKKHMVQDWKREHFVDFHNTWDSIGAYVKITKWPRGHYGYSVDGATLVYSKTDFHTNYYYAVQLPVATGHRIRVTEHLARGPGGGPPFHWPLITVSDPIPLCINRANDPIHPLLKETIGMNIPLNINDSDDDDILDLDDEYVEGDDPDLVAVQVRHPKGLPITLAWSNDIIHLYERQSKKYGLSATSRNARVGCNFSTNNPHTPYKGYDDEILYVEGVNYGTTDLTLTGPGNIEDKIKINVVIKVEFDNVWVRNLQHAQDSYPEYQKCIAVEWNGTPSELDLKNYLTIEPSGLSFDDIKDHVSFNIEHQIFGSASIKNDSILDYSWFDPDDANIYAFGVQLLCGGSVVDRVIVVVYSNDTQTEHTDWIAQNTAEGTAWLNELPPVYSALGTGNADPEPAQCDPQRWRVVNNSLPAFYHFNAAFEIRSEQTPGRHGHQACYADNASLITGAGSLSAIASSGTADFGYRDNLYAPLHVIVDVNPFLRAAQLDGNPIDGLANLNHPLIRIGPHLQTYYTWRPALAGSTRAADQCVDPATCSFH